MLSRTLTIVLSIVFFTVAGIGSAVVAVGWLDTQVTSGSVTSSTVPDLLYICESAGAFSSDCSAGDDSGPDEVIFETDEQLVPGGAAKDWAISLVNIGGSNWTITGVAPTFVETMDPGDDCTSQPELKIEIFQDGALPDDPYLGSNPLPYPALPRLNESHWYTVRVQATQTEQIRLRVWLPASFPVECQGGSWDLSVDWTAEIS